MTYEEAEKILANDRDYCLKHKRKKIYGAEAIFVDTDLNARRVTTKGGRCARTLSRSLKLRPKEGRGNMTTAIIGLLVCFLVWLHGFMIGRELTPPK